MTEINTFTSALQELRKDVLTECQTMIERATNAMLISVDDMIKNGCTCGKTPNPISSTTDRLQDLVVQALMPEPIQPGAVIMDDSLYGVAGIAKKLYELDAFRQKYKSAESLAGNLGSTLNGLAEDEYHGPVIRVPVVLRHKSSRNGNHYWKNKPTWGYYRRTGAPTVRGYAIIQAETGEDGQKVIIHPNVGKGAV